MTLEEYNKKIEEIVSAGRAEMAAETAITKADIVKALSEKTMTHAEFAAMTQEKGAALKKKLRNIEIHWKKQILKLQRQYFKEFGNHLLKGEFDKIG